MNDDTKTKGLPAIESIREKTYSILTKEKSYTVKARNIAWTENGEFVLLMDGETTKHLIIAANVIAVTEQ